MFGRTGASLKEVYTCQKMSDSSVTFSGMWVPLYGVLRHLKVRSVRHDILWHDGSVRRIAKSELNSWFLYTKLNVRKCM